MACLRLTEVISELDTLYFTDGVENKAVGFTDEGLSFWTDTVMGGSDYLKVALADINDTTLLKLKYGSEAAIVEAFVNDGDIYNVTDGAADIYVGAVATHNQGVSFAGAGEATVTVDGLFGNGNINNTYTTIENFETLIGDSSTTFIIGGDTLKAADSLSAVTIKSSEDGTSTVAGVGDWKLNDSTVTLNSTSSLVSGESGLEVLTAGMIAYAAATLASDLDKIIYSDTESLKGSSKNENIIVSNNKYLDISSGGEDTICLTNADTVTINGYDAKTGSTFLTNTSENLTNLIMYGDPYLLVVGDGYFKADNLGRVVLEGTDTIDGTFVNFTVLNENTTQLYGWSGQAGGNVDGSEYTQDAIIIGVAPSGYSTLKGGSGDDTIYAAADDVVNLSGGNDIIDIDHLDREWRINGNKGGLTINLGDGNISAQTTVKGFDTSQDKIALDDIGELSVDSSGDKLQIAVNNSSLTFAAGTEQLMITDDTSTYTIHTNFDNLTPTSNYIIETSDGTFETPDKGLKKAENEYTYSSGDNTITGFNFGADESADELIIDSEITEVTFDEAGNLKVKVDEDNQLQISNAANKIIKVNANEQDWIVEFGDNLMYNESVNCYGDNSDTRLWVHKDYIGEELAILANGSDGKIYNNVKEITAKAYSGEATLVGNELENVITASKGSSSLWGGEGSDNDTLIGSSGYDEFFYRKGNENDVIRHAEDSDLINLLDINLEDISSTSINALSIKIEFNDGGSLSMNTLNDLTFQLADGSKWQSDKNHKTWISK